MLQCLIFDVDGVLVDSPHEAAWGEAMVRLAHDTWHVTHAPYSTEIYQTHVAGQARTEGAQSLLRAVGIEDPDGARARELAEVKQALILEEIDAGRFQAFPDAVGLALRAETAGMRIAVASSSKNADAMLRKVRIQDGRTLFELFPTNVCGMDFERGKPHPAIFLTAAQRAGCEPWSCAVVEDAPNGVEAAKAAGMFCVGIARLDDEYLLRQAGADTVVHNLADLDLTDLTPNA